MQKQAIKNIVNAHCCL